ncbi:DUF924 family protein [Leptodesmis sichuanensis]|uniref:DUF924 family protein n=1 Tax=Leptodesmis sichuanensis TaxID=2906798 RepID=UPI001F363BFD|nr:DUF924 family protein [Leptodesmis sichuanensis]UIE38204.1 DUF924 domain-containing protein [Leptodesmis sichuanensis A121]
MAQIDEIICFWFTEPDGTTGKNRKVWFTKDPEFDAIVHDRFLVAYQQAAIGALDPWQESATGCLALILLLDQFPRNIFRGQPESFATDAKALAVAQRAIFQGFDQALPLIQRWFVYMPFMHSEDLAIQRQSVELFRQFTEDPETQSSYPYAIKHLEVIERFGRFPHRNAILGRENTPEETEFLKQPGSSF